MDKKFVSKNFSHGAKSYDFEACVQKESAKKLCEFASDFIKEKSRILDLGSGTSFIAKNLSGKKSCEIFEIDLSLEMLKSWRDKDNQKIYSAVCDIENLCFRKSFFDILISSFSLQWIKNFEENFKKFYEILKEDGIFIFCIPLFSSLHELQDISKKSGCNFRFYELPKLENIESAIEFAGFQKVFSSTETLFQDFKNPLESLKSLKKIGANFSSSKKNFITKNNFRSFCSDSNSLEKKHFSASWKIAYFICKKNDR